MPEDLSDVHLLQANDLGSERSVQAQDSVWKHLQGESYLVVPARLNAAGLEQVNELVIDVVGVLPPRLEGWHLLLG